MTTQTKVQRSIFHALRKKVVELGYSPNIDLYGNTPADKIAFDAASLAIRNIKGFVVELYSESSARSKYAKDNPRIVVSVSRVYNGDVGAPPGLIHIPQTINGVLSYKSGILPSQSSNIVFSIYLLSKKTKEEILLNDVLSKVLGTRKYIPYYDNPTEHFFIQQTTFNDLDDTIENIMEKAYTYTVSDIYIADTEIITPVVAAISEITLEVKELNISPDITIIP